MCAHLRLYFSLLVSRILISMFTCVLAVASLIGGVSTPSSGATATMGGDLLTPLSAGLEGLSLGGQSGPAYQVRGVHIQ